MELDKNGLLITYLDSTETQDLYNSYIKKFPTLNEYAENYLANLDKSKLNKELNNNSNENIIGNNSFVKGSSNDISNNETITQTNQISKINDIFNNIKYNETNDIEKPFYSKLKTRNYFSIEHLKKNFCNRNNKINTISKENKINSTQKDDKLIIKSLQNINFPINQKKKKGLSELYKKISTPYRTNMNSPLFSAIRNNNSKNSYSSKPLIFNNNYKLDYLNLSKNKSFLSEKHSTNNYNIKTKLKKIGMKISSSYLAKNFLTNYIYSDREKFKKNRKKLNKKNDDRIQIKYSESHTDESFIPFISISNRCNTNKSFSQSIKDYWKLKEIKKQIKIQKIRNEKKYKEISEIRDKPEIDENSRKITEKLWCNSSQNVFHRLSELARNKLIFNERKLNIKNDNNNYKIRLCKEKNYKDINKKGLESDKNFKSLKQMENINTILTNRIIKQWAKKKKNEFKNLNKFINKKECTKCRDTKKDNSYIIFLNKDKKQWNNSYNSGNKINIETVNLKQNNIINKLKNKNDDRKPKIIDKKINRKNKENNNINKNSNSNDKKKYIYINKPDNYSNSKNKTFLSNCKSKKNILNQKSRNEKIYSYNIKTKNTNLVNKIKNHKNQQDLNKLIAFSNRKIKENELLNINYKSNNNKLYTEGNSDYIISNNSKLNKYKTINILNINCKNNNINNSLRKKTSNKNCVNNENKPHKKLINKKLNKSYLIKLDKDNELKKLKINNKNVVDISKYFKMQTKKEEYRNNNKNYYINDYGNPYCDNLENNHFENKTHKNNISIKEEINNCKINSTDENPINKDPISYITEEQLNNIKKRRLELLKFLDFSSSIGTNFNNNC